jgi:hypothetical protein
MLNVAGKTLEKRPVGTLLKVMVVILIAICCFGYPIFVEADTHNVRYDFDYVTVLNRSYTPEHISNFDPVSGVFLPAMAYHPNVWTVTVRVDGQVKEFKVNRWQYNKIRTGQTVAALYKIGKYSGEIYPEGVVE